MQALSYFNPRSHERSDLTTMQNNRGFSDFNPRSHERSDRYTDMFDRMLYISIHAPTRGATPSGLKLPSVSNFNPRSHERSDTTGEGDDFS